MSQLFRCCAVDATRCHGPCAVWGFWSPCWWAAAFQVVRRRRREASQALCCLGVLVAGVQEKLLASHSRTEVRHEECRSFSGAAPSTPRGATGLVLSGVFGRRAGGPQLFRWCAVDAARRHRPCAVSGFWLLVCRRSCLQVALAPKCGMKNAAAFQVLRRRRHEVPRALCCLGILVAVLVGNRCCIQVTLAPKCSMQHAAAFQVVRRRRREASQACAVSGFWLLVCRRSCLQVALAPKCGMKNAAAFQVLRRRRHEVPRALCCLGVAVLVGNRCCIQVTLAPKCSMQHAAAFQVVRRRRREASQALLTFVLSVTVCMAESLSVTLAPKSSRLFRCNAVHATCSAIDAKRWCGHLLQSCLRL